MNFFKRIRYLLAPTKPGRPGERAPSFESPNGRVFCPLVNQWISSQYTCDPAVGGRTFFEDEKSRIKDPLLPEKSDRNEFLKLINGTGLTVQDAILTCQFCEAYCLDKDDGPQAIPPPAQIDKNKLSKALSTSSSEALWDAIAEQSNTLAALDRFLKAGGDINEKHKETASPLLHYAIEMQDIPLVQAMLKTGADIQITNVFGHTPLHRAVNIDIDGVMQTKGDMSVIDFIMTRLLLASGADSSMPDKEGKTARDWAVSYSPQLADEFDALMGHFEFPASGWLNDYNLEASVACSDTIIRGVVKRIEPACKRSVTESDLGMIEIENVEVFKAPLGRVDKPFRLYVSAITGIDAPEFVVGENVFIFCCSDAAGHSYPLGGPTGKYSISDGRVIQNLNNTIVPVADFLNRLRDVLQEQSQKSLADAGRRYEKVIQSIDQRNRKEALQNLYIFEGLYPEDGRIKQIAERLKAGHAG